MCIFCARVAVCDEGRYVRVSNEISVICIYMYMYMYMVYVYEQNVYFL